MGKLFRLAACLSLQFLNPWGMIPMKNSKKIEQYILAHEKLLVVTLLLLLGMIIYVPRIWQLGFYAEDWYVLWGGKLTGFFKIFDMHLVDRPMLGLHSAILYFFFGEHPLPYHIYTLGLRILSSIVLYFVIRKGFIDSFFAGLFGSIIFLLYPGFLVQPVAFTHSNYLLAFLLVISSLLTTISFLDSKNKNLRILLVILSGGFAVVGYSLMEWFIAFELIRLVLMYRKLNSINTEQRFFQKLVVLVKKYLPVGVFVLIFLVVRVFVFKSARSTTDIGETLQLIFQSPIEFTINFFVITFHNIFAEIFAAWVVPLYRLFNLTTNKDLLFAIFVALIVILIILFSIRVIGKKETNLDELQIKTKQLIWLSLSFILVSLIPLSVINRNIAFDSLYSKYSLPGLFGVCLLITTLLSSIRSKGLKNSVLFLLVFIGVVTNQLNSAYYRDYSDIQKRLWWQLSWRTPNVKEGSTLLPLLPEGYRFSDNWEIWSQANLTYGDIENPLRLNAEVINSETIRNIISNYSYGRNFRKIHLVVDMNNPLVIGMSSPTACVHFIDGTNYETMVSDDNIINLISERSKIDLLDVGSMTSIKPDPILFGPEPEHDWCYYYQKASLYRQQENWQELNKLSDEAIDSGFVPTYADEWLPMYEGYVRTNQIDEANNLAGIIKSDELFVINYCPVKVDLLENSSEIEKTMTNDICSWFINKYR